MKVNSVDERALEDREILMYAMRGILEAFDRFEHLDRIIMETDIMSPDVPIQNKIMFDLWCVVKKSHDIYRDRKKQGDMYEKK